MNVRTDSANAHDVASPYAMTCTKGSSVQLRIALYVCSAPSHSSCPSTLHQRSCVHVLSQMIRTWLPNAPCDSDVMPSRNMVKIVSTASSPSNMSGRPSSPATFCRSSSRGGVTASLSLRAPDPYSSSDMSWKAMRAPMTSATTRMRRFSRGIDIVTIVTCSTKESGKEDEKVLLFSNAYLRKRRKVGSSSLEIHSVFLSPAGGNGAAHDQRCCSPCSNSKADFSCSQKSVGADLWRVAAIC